MLGSGARLTTPIAPLARAKQSDLVSALAGFFHRKLTTAESGKILIDQWLADLTKKQVVANSQDPWQALAKMPLIDKAVLARVQNHYDQLGRGERVNLTSLHNDLRTLKGNLL